MRTTAPTLALLVSVVLAACKDDSPTVAPPDPASFALTLPDTAYAGQAFDLTVTAVANDGTTPDATFSGEVALSVAGGSVSPSTVLVVAGVGQESVTLMDLAGTSTISASFGSVSGSASLLVVGLEPVASVRIVPGSFLFTDASQTRQLTAWAFDANGNPTQATFTWSSADPGLVDVDATGLATSESGLGSTEVFAEAEGIQSDPATALLAKPVAGAVLVGDDHVARAATPAAAPGASQVSGPAAAGDYEIEPVDVDADYGVGWQYRVTLTGVDAPTAGEVLVGTGEAPIAGRVVSVQTTGTTHIVTLELIPLDEVFEEIALDIDRPLDEDELVFTEEVAAAYSVERGPEGILLTPRQVPGPLEFDLLGFECKTDVGLPLQFRVVPEITLRPSLRRVITVDQTGLTRNGVVGTVSVGLKAKPKIAARLEGSINCKAKLADIPFPLPGPLGVFLGGRVPVGAGLEIKGTGTFAEFGVTYSASASMSLEVGLGCTGPGIETCEGYQTHQGTVSTSMELDPLQIDPGARLEVRIYPYLFVSLGVGAGPFPLPGTTTLELVRMTLGPAQDVDLRTMEAQIEDDGYHSNFELSLMGVLRPGSAIDKVLSLFKRTAVKLEAREIVPLTSSPVGTLTVSNDQPKATTLDQVGDSITFRVEMDKSTYLQAEAIDAMHLVKTRSDGQGGLDYSQLDNPCFTISASPGQTVFECRTDFKEPDVGEVQFHALMEAKILGAPLPGYYEIGDDATVIVNVQPPGPNISVSPSPTLLPNAGTAQFTATVRGLTDPSVTWTATVGTIDNQGGYTGPDLPEGASVVDTIFATSVEDPAVKGKALAVVMHARIPMAAIPCTPSPSDDCSREGRSWGDPHVQTPDGFSYDFMAAGDYVLARSTDPEDDFEVQARYVKPIQSELFSWNNAVAMRVMGNTVEIHASAGGPLRVLVNGAPDLRTTASLNGASLDMRDDTVVVSWPDRTMVLVEASGTSDVLRQIKVILPDERSGAVEGLLGNFDGSPLNDLRTSDGEVLELGTTRLYTDYRQGWWIPVNSPESLFGDGVEHFDSGFPPGAVTISDLDFDDVARATGVCRDAGVLDPDVMEKCILDVVLTGDDGWALVAVGADPNTLGIIVSPATAYLAPDDSQEFGAVLTGTTDRRVQWSATGGSIVPSSDNVMTYTAPTEPGTYTITATSLFDGSLVTTATVEVTGGPSGYSKVWNGSINSDWTRADNWTPAGMPDSTDNVYIPTGMPNVARWLNGSTVVNDITIESGAVYNGGSDALRVRGNAVMDAGQYVPINMEGANKTVRGRMGELTITGSVRASGPIDLQGNALRLQGGTFDVGGQRVDARQLYAPGGGRLVMHSPDDHLVVQSVNLQSLSSTAGTLTDGTLEVRNGDFQLEQNASFFATGAHRLVFSGDGSQAGTLGLGCGGCWDLVNPLTNWRLNNIEFSNPAGVVVGTHPVRVDGVVSVTDGVVSDSGSQLHLFGALLVQGGSFDAGFTVRAPTVVLPTRVGGTVKFGSEGTDGTLAMTLSDDFEAGGVWIANGSGVTLGGHTLRVDGSLTTRWGASLVMDSDADSLIVSGPIDFGTGSQNVAGGSDLFSAGVFEVRGNVVNQFHHFRSTGTNKVLFSGMSAQTATIYCAGLGGCESQDTTYQDVEIANPAGVTFMDSPARITGDLSVLGGAAATFDANVVVDQSLDLAGTLTVNATRTLSITDTLLLRSTGVLNNDGTVTTANCSKEAGYAINGVDPCP